MVGKRKRETTVVSKPKKKESPPPADNAQDVFRKLFEAQFEPLDLPGHTAKPAHSTDSEGDEDEDEDEDELSGSELGSDDLSDFSDVSNEVEVVEHTDAHMAPEDRMDKKTRKAFLSGKLLSNLEKPSANSDDPATKKEEEDDAHDAVNLKHDLALQRLLKESHLLDSADDLAPTGKNRLKALDMRMQSLGAKSSLYAQKMPDAHRRGINAKAASKEDKRRREAKENGIILEKPNKASKSNSGRRERGVGGSSVGKFSGGTLNLNKQDIAHVQASGRRMTGGRGKGKSRGRGGSRGGGRGGSR
ncbi:uncharacterized protein N7446_009783 [Penicillium canescens]|uniref:Protein FAF1 n=1 Tax=Penicillium canescens TaxID=5083 RepID=A0AAD6I7Y6_PENCN|nr:uncharacterized protein N7446_009783 [Penicillium canescens]KAJ6035024.1 hypothetical protein N7460_009199 [Penicillium canescens]KAJ6046686.1 hypothetical protein N7444_007940 [Penicillium canescens]KAJ6053771.1 hypothetical protein N7446_009783 [Penicillium canescens]